MSDMTPITPQDAAKALGRLGGAATKGIRTRKKIASSRRNAAKARAALAELRAKQNQPTQ